jgi:hypothetical protein
MEKGRVNNFFRMECRKANCWGCYHMKMQHNILERSKLFFLPIEADRSMTLDKAAIHSMLKLTVKYLAYLFAFTALMRMTDFLSEHYY